MAVLPNGQFWTGKRVLVTGHTGFKGAWLTYWLCKMGAHVTGISLAPDTDPSLSRALEGETPVIDIITDIRDADRLKTEVQKARPEIVLHLAAQALVRRGYANPLETYQTNVMGTANLLEAIRSSDQARVAVMITTDKVYQNREAVFPFRETDTLGGRDPYSSSKAASELVIAGYRDSFLSERGVAVASARAGNVIGGGDWAADRLIPDAVRAWFSGAPLAIRRPMATRPWQHVLEPLCGYLVLAERLWHQPELAGAYNFGPQTSEAATVEDVITIAQEALSAQTATPVTWGDGTEGPHEASWLALEIAKSRSALGVEPRWTVQQSVRHTMQWYLRFHNGESALSLCEEDLQAYALSGGHQ